MPHRGTGMGIWYNIEPTDDPDALFVTYPHDTPETWLLEMGYQIRQRIGPFNLEYLPYTDSPSVVQIIARTSLN